MPRHWNPLLALRQVPIVPLLLAVLSFTPLVAQEPSINQRPIVIGVDEEYYPFEFSDSSHRADGFSVDLLKEIGREQGLEFHFRPDAWSVIRQEIDLGLIDAVSGMFRSKSREKTLVFSSPHLTVDYAIFVRKKTPQLQSEDDLHNQTVLLQDATVVHEHFSELQFPARIIPLRSDRIAIQQLAAGQGDAAVLTQLGGNALRRELNLTNIQQSSGPLMSLEYCFAAPKKNMALLQILDRGLAQLRENGEYDRIYRKWFGPPPRRASLVQMLQIGAWFALPLLGLLGLIFLWNRTLARRVDQKTRELQEHQEQLEDQVKERTSDLKSALDRFQIEVDEHRKTEEELRSALEQVKRLSGLLPICAACKKIRNDQGFWTQVEEYLKEHSDLTFSHGICPECFVRLYPEMASHLHTHQKGSS